MKMYVACSLTESHDREVVRTIVEYLQNQGYEVLDEHVGHADYRARFAENTGISLDDKTQDQKELIIRDTDLAWVREAEGFIGLFFSASVGASIEFEHRRLLLDLQHKGLLQIPLVSSKLFLCVFLKDAKRSALLHGLNPIERRVIKQEYIDKKEDALEIVKRHLAFY